MIYFATGWRYHWRRWLGWIPLQFCMVCGKPYWGGLPSVRIVQRRSAVSGKPSHLPRLECDWLPWWKEYCSLKCCHQDRTLGIWEQLKATPAVQEATLRDLPAMFDLLHAIQTERATKPVECIGWDIGDDYSAIVWYLVYPDGRIEMLRDTFTDHRSIYEQWISKHPLAP